MSDFSWLALIINMIEIGILATIFYYILRLLRGTQGIIMLIALFVLLTIISLLVHFFNMEVLDWLLKQIFKILPLFLIIIFQNEIRRTLLFLGRHKFQIFQKLSSDQKNLEKENMIDEIVDAVCAFTTQPAWKFYRKPEIHNIDAPLSNENIGALIAIERNVVLGDYISKGVPLYAQVNSMLLQTIFYKGTPLHDGGVIIRTPNIVAAAAQFPLSQGKEEGPTHSRHQAALGLAEDTDALIILVSEESGDVTLSTHGSVLKKMRSPKELSNYLRLYLNTPITHKKITTNAAN
ncbi:MAG: diadenylate cyclase [Lentisphaeria bacterium]